MLSTQMMFVKLHNMEIKAVHGYYDITIVCYAND